MPQGGSREAAGFSGQAQSWASHPSRSGTGNDVRGCKRRRSAMSPSPSSASEEVNPFISEKERRELLSGEDSGSETNEDEDIKLAEPPAKKFAPSKETLKLLSSASSRPMKNEARKVIGKLPISACDMAHPPKLNESVSWLIPKSARSHDKYLSKLQRFTTDAMGPIAWLWDKMQQGSVDVNTTRSAIHSSLLMGNASATL